MYMCVYIYIHIHFFLITIIIIIIVIVIVIIIYSILYKSVKITVVLQLGQQVRQTTSKATLLGLNKYFTLMMDKLSLNG